MSFFSLEDSSLTFDIRRCRIIRTTIWDLDEKSIECIEVGSNRDDSTFLTSALFLQYVPFGLIVENL